jgi:hypothetical protein
LFLSPYTLTALPLILERFLASKVVWQDEDTG